MIFGATALLSDNSKKRRQPQAGLLGAVDNSKRRRPQTDEGRSPARDQLAAGREARDQLAAGREAARISWPLAAKPRDRSIPGF
jgi:hypothetical protein